jgi:hypothetical protein
LAFGPGIPTTIASGEANDGSYLWTVPDTPTNAGKIEVIAHHSNGDSASAMSAEFLNIQNVTDADISLVPEVDFLSAAAPNPFQGTTTLRFGLSQPGPARLTIFDARGRLVRELVSGPLPAGENVVRWDGRNRGGARVASGFYIVRFEAGGRTFHRQVSYLR